MNFIKDASFTHKLANEVYLECNKLTSNKPYLLITIMFAKLIPTKEVYDFYANEERALRIIRECFVLNSSALRLAANFYFKVKKPIIPSKVFSTEKEAMDWLQEAMVIES